MAACPPISLPAILRTMGPAEMPQTLQPRHPETPFRGMPDQPDRPRALLMTLARNVRAARLRFGLPVEDLAYLADVEVAVVEAIERGEGGSTDVSALERLAWALGVTLSDLVGTGS